VALAVLFAVTGCACVGALTRRWHATTALSSWFWGAAAMFMGVRVIQSAILDLALYLPDNEAPTVGSNDWNMLLLNYVVYEALELTTLVYVAAVLRMWGNALAVGRAAGGGRIIDVLPAITKWAVAGWAVLIIVLGGCLATPLSMTVVFAAALVSATFGVFMAAQFVVYGCVFRRLLQPITQYAGAGPAGADAAAKVRRITVIAVVFGSAAVFRAATILVYAASLPTHHSYALADTARIVTFRLVYFPVVDMLPVLVMFGLTIRRPPSTTRTDRTERLLPGGAGSLQSGPSAARARSLRNLPAPPPSAPLPGTGAGELMDGSDLDSMDADTAATSLAFVDSAAGPPSWS